MSLKRTAAAVFAATFITAGCGESTITEIVQVEPPPPVSTPVTINVNASQISGSFTLGGGPFPGSVYQNGDMFLHDTQTGSMLELGDSHDQAYDMMVVHGMYDSVYQHTDGTDVPVNDYATVVSGIAVNSSSTSTSSPT